ncbi:hypothetical protein BS78_10G215300 [Paspalum vaginatum]|nr:hypothetical protein BS78_10G215300 [Paspalum vaginatum]
MPCLLLPIPSTTHISYCPVIPLHAAPESHESNMVAAREGTSILRFSCLPILRFSFLLPRGAAAIRRHPIWGHLPCCRCPLASTTHHASRHQTRQSVVTSRPLSSMFVVGVPDACHTKGRLHRHRCSQAVSCWLSAAGLCRLLPASAPSNSFRGDCYESYAASKIAAACPFYLSTKDNSGCAFGGQAKKKLNIGTHPDKQYVNPEITQMLITCKPGIEILGHRL